MCVDPLAPYQVRMTVEICLRVTEVYNTIVQTEGGMYFPDCLSI